MDPAVQQQAAQFQGRQAARAVQTQSREMMREAMQTLQQQAENELARTLDKNQAKRLKEIQLQVQGPGAVLREDIAERLEIREDQHAEIQAVLAQANMARRDIMQKNFQFMRSLVPNQAAGGNPPAPGGQPVANAPADAAAGGAQTPKLDRLAKLGKADVAVAADAAVPTGRTTGVSIGMPSRKPWSSLRLKPRWKKLARRFKKSRGSFAIASTPWFSRPWIDVR